MATNDKLTAFNINSMDIKIMSGLRRMSTPTTPIVKIIALTMRYADNGIDTSRATTQNQGDPWVAPTIRGLRFPAQYHRAKDSYDNQQACQLNAIDGTVENGLAKDI